jgi:hypothetical protein
VSYAADWSLEGVDGPVEGTLFQHVESALTSSGLGPVPAAAQELPDEPPRDPAKMRWIGGAMDSLVRVSGPEGAVDRPAAAAAAVSVLTRSPPDTRMVLASAELVDELGGPQAIDQFIDAVRQDRCLDRARVAELARWFCCHGTRRGVVKAGLALLGATGTASDRFLIQRLGLLEELTLYAVVALRNLLSDPDEAIFELAQQVTGWGRIQAIARLDGTADPRIQSWLLRGGAENDVMTEEIAYIAATTGDLRSALEGEADEALLEHGGELLRSLACGGPAKDMSDYADGAAAIGAFLRHMGSARLTSGRVGCLQYLERYLAEWAKDNALISDAERRSLLASVSQVLSRPECAEVVIELLRADTLGDVTRGLGLADRFEIDARPVARSWLQRSLVDGYLWQWLLQHTSVDELDCVLDEACRLLPLATLASGPEDNLGLGLEYQADGALRIIVQHLRAFPAHGWLLVATALKNRVTGGRNGALKVLDVWPTEAWPPSAREAIAAALEVEPRADVRENMRALLDHGKLPERRQS